MKHLPEFETFRKLANDVDMVPVYRQLTSDTLTPVQAYSKLKGDSAFLFESVVGGEKVGRFSFLGDNPFMKIEAFANSVIVTEGDTPREYFADDPLKELEKLLERYRAVHLAELPRFCGGAVGYAGYDVIRYAEHLPNAPEDDRKVPDMAFAFFDRMIIFDHIRKTILVVCHADANSKDLQNEYDRAAARVDELCQQLQEATSDIQPADVSIGGEPTLEYQSNFEQKEFEQAVENCKEYIKAGDIFQVVISQRLKLDTTSKPLSIYRALRVVNPSPFMFLLKTSGMHLVGASPEIMVRAEDGEITIRPLAGTRKRGATPAEDQALADELLADEKERAEHVMLVDLARNDVGRIAKYGSVTLNDVMVVERYSHVMHITSNVYGQLRDGLSALDSLRAGLPAGTVSGAPKVRAMQIIDEQERHRRGPYAGAVGYIDFTGNMDTCIALRTLVMQDQTVYVQAGAGIVADSVPESEYHETLNKAKGLLRAIELAEQQF
jgi:anthranilate synthase component 1